MIRFFLILSLLLLNFERVLSEEEGLSRQEKNLLRSIERIDKKNEEKDKSAYPCIVDSHLPSSL